MKNGVKTLCLQDFPTFQAVFPESQPCYQIAAYLQQLLEECEAQQQGCVITLPPLMAMSRFFRASHLAVYDAFQLLRRQGYDYNLVALDNPIDFWRTPPS